MMPLAEISSNPSETLLLEGETALPLHLSLDPEQLSHANDLRWGVTSRKQHAALVNDFCFDERSASLLFHDSFNSTNTAFSTSTLDDDLPPQLPKRRTIAFADTVQVREFDVILGDDRLCKYPMTLSWKLSKEYSFDMHEREIYRASTRQQQQLLSVRQQQCERRRDEELVERRSTTTSESDKKLSVRKVSSSKSTCHLNTRERRIRLRSNGCSNTELVQSLRKRKIRLCLDYAYGYQDSLEAARSFQDEHFRYII